MKKFIEKKLQDWEPHQIYQTGKGNYDMVIRFGKINQGFIITKTGTIIADVHNGYAVINEVKKPVWKILGYSSKLTFMNDGINVLSKQFAQEHFGPGR